MNDKNRNTAYRSPVVVACPDVRAAFMKELEIDAVASQSRLTEQRRCVFLSHLATALEQHFRRQVMEVLYSIDKRSISPAINRVDVNF